MSALDIVTDEYKANIVGALSGRLRELLQFRERFEERKECLEYCIAHPEDLEAREAFMEKGEKNPNSATTVKENAPPNEQNLESTLGSTRGRSTRKIVSQAPAPVEEIIKPVKIKKEKISMMKSTQSELTLSVKTEKEDMPAPQRPAPRTKRQAAARKTAVQVKQEKMSGIGTRASHKNSDIILQEAVIPVVDLVDENLDIVPRTTRARTKQNKKKLAEEDATKKRLLDETQNESVRGRSKRHKSLEEGGESKAEEEENTNATNLEVNNATFVTQPSQVNTTVVIDKPKFAPQIPAELMTDDESGDDVTLTAKASATPVKVPVSKKPGPKSRTVKVFSSFDQSPVKKKVEAYENLSKGTTPSNIPRSTQKPTSVLVKSSSVKEKTKIFTPTSSRFIPTTSSTALKAQRPCTTPKTDNGLLSTKTVSAIKGTQAELRERERRTEEDALRKKEALLQAQIQEKKAKREEKQLKAQRQREALRNQREKSIEITRKKEDERHNKLIAEQEAMKQKQKEEAERKRLLAKTKAAEEKKKEEVVQKLPLFLTTKPRLLPTPDCYDSDDEMHSQRTVVAPSWSTGSECKVAQMVMKTAGDTVMNTFFSRHADTPDLVRIFEIIDKKKLKRSSSAMWTKPPRFTMLPVKFHNIEEDGSDLE